MKKYIYLLLALLFIYRANSQTVLNFTSPGTGNFTVPCGVTTLTVECWGGGGAGGGSTNSAPGNAGSGGGGGGYVTATIAVTPSSTISYTVGAGGAPNAGGSGTTGGSSIFNSSVPVSATGGVGGNPNGGISGSGGTGTGGTVTPGLNGIVGSGTTGGTGGNCTGGGGGNGGAGGVALAAGGIGNSPGGGGGGAGAGTNTIGGSGGNGKITIRYTPYATTFTAQNLPAQTLCQNDPPGPLTVTASGTGLTYQWFKNNVASNSGGTIMPTETNPNVLPDMSILGTTYYYCVVTSPCDNITSNVSGPILVKPVPTATAMADHNVCQNLTDNLTATASGGSGSGYVFNWYSVLTGGTSLGTGSPFTTGSLSTVGVTNFYVEVTDGAGCKSPRDNVQVTVDPRPSITNSPLSSTICSGLTFNLGLTCDIAGSVFSWNAADNTNISGETTSLSNTSTIADILTSTNHSANEAVIYYLSAAFNGCPGPTSVYTLTVKPAPNPPPISSLNDITCFGLNNGQVQFSAITGGSGGPNSYSIDNISYQAGGLFTSLTPGNYTAYSKDGSGCKSNTTTAFTITEPTVLGGSVTTSSVSCSGGNNGSVIVTPSGGSTPFQYSINGGAFVGTPTFTGLTAGNHFVNVKDNNGCTTSNIAFTITQPSPITMTFGGNSTVCNGSAFGITLTPNGGTPGYTNQWVTGNNALTTGESTTSVTSSIINDAITNTSGVFQPFTYTVTTTDANSCVVTNTVMASVYSAPSITSTPSGNVCSGQAFSLALTSNMASANFSWIATDNVNTTGESLATQTSATLLQTITNNSTVNESVNITITPTDTVTTCVGIPQAFVLTVKPLPVATPSSNSPVCESSALDLSSNLIGGAVYNWAGPNGFTSTLQNPSISFATLSASGTYSLTISSGGCTSVVATTTAIVNPNPVSPSIGSGSPVCLNDTIFLYSNLIAGATYNWAGPNSFTSNLQNPQILNATAAAAGTYSLNVVVNGCSSATSVTNLAFDPTPSFTLSSSSPICEGSNLGLNVLGLNGGSAFNFNWSGPGLFSSILQNPIRNNIIIGHNGTYIVDIRNEFGCSKIDSITITVNQKPNAIVTGGPGAICAYDSAHFNGSSSLAGSGTILSYQWLNGNTLISGATNQVFNTNVAGNYSLEVINTNGCKDTSLINPVVLKNTPTAVIGGTNSFCSGSSFSLNGASSTAGGSSTLTTYAWLLNNTVISGASTVNETFNTSGNYQVIVTNSDNCVDTSSVLFVSELFPPATPSILQSSGNYCVGSSITASVLNPTIAHSYLWSVNPANLSLSSPTDTTTIIGGEMSGTYSLEVVETDLNGCSSSPGIVNITVNALPIAVALSPSADTICYNSFVAVGLSNTGVSAYNWTSSFGATSPSQYPTFSFITQLGNIQFYGTVTDANGCTSLNDTVNVFVENPPTVFAGNDVTVCSGSSVTLTATGTATSFSWNNGVVDGVSFIPAGTNSYIVTGSNSGCSINDTLFVVVNSGPTINGGVDQAVCAGNQVTLTSSGNAATVSWNNGVTDGIAFTPSATQNYVVTGTSSTGCTSNDTVVVTVNTLPVVGINASTQNVCSGSSVTLSGTNAVSYSWTGGIINGVAFTPGSTLNYTVTGTDANACSDTDTITVYVISLPSVSANASINNVCPGTAINLSASGGNSYAWSNGIGGALITVFPPISTSFTVTGTDLNGCSDTAVVNLNILPKPPTPVATSSSSTECLNTAVNLSSNAAAANNFWFDVSTGALLSNLVSFNHTESVAGTYTYGLFVQSPVGCNSDTATVSVSFNPCITSLANEYIFISANSSSNGNILTNDGSPTGLTITTSPVFGPVNGTFSIGSTGSFNYTPNSGYSGADMVVIQACNASSICFNDTIFFVINPLAIADAGTVSGLISGSVLNGNVLINDIGSGLSNATLVTNVNNGTLTLNTNGSFTYTPNVGYCGQDSFRYQTCDIYNLCATTQCYIDVNCDTEIETHNAFSPNNDGKNDLWILGNIDNTENNVTVLDRWGNEVWKGTNYDNINVVWDGKNASGTPLPAGTYFYLIVIKDKAPQRGWIELTK